MIPALAKTSLFCKETILSACFSTHASILSDTKLSDLPRGVTYTSVPSLDEFDYKKVDRPLTAFEMTCNSHSVTDTGAFFLDSTIDIDRLKKAIDDAHASTQCMSLGVKFDEADDWWRYFELDADARPKLQIHEEVLRSQEEIESRTVTEETALSTHQLCKWHLYPIAIEEGPLSHYTHMLYFFVNHSLLSGSGLVEMGRIINAEYTGTELKRAPQASPSMPALMNPAGLELPTLSEEVLATPIELFPRFEGASHIKGTLRKPDTPYRPALAFKCIHKTDLWRHKGLSLSNSLLAASLVHSAAYQMLEADARGEDLEGDIGVSFSLAIIIDWLFSHFGEDAWRLLGNNFAGTPSLLRLGPDSTVKDIGDMIAEVRASLKGKWTSSPEEFLGQQRVHLQRPVTISEHLRWPWTAYTANLGMVDMGEGPLSALFANATKSADPDHSCFVDIAMCGDPKTGLVFLTVDVPDNKWPAEHGGHVMIEHWLTLLDMCRESEGAVSIRDMMGFLHRELKL
eukprot:gnl/Dysnectes_brevis/7527_a12703_327.p1 GENE.gnl/Dysnectes_brevis/7527_a12703_327~~gnl/Dysnectes_brevis/7527_a12703_327.p1  ORF type:complete len:513 (-),score=170.77 gnl/Dysnectes_brevis/7527_a12703_327:122-1660(-)